MDKAGIGTIRVKNPEEGTYMSMLKNRTWIRFSTQKLRRALRINFLIALGVVAVAGTVNRVQAQAINGFGVWSWGTVADLNGVDMGPSSSQTCFLSGVAGQLNKGDQGATASCGQLSWNSEALVTLSANGNYRLFGHGASCEGQQNQPISFGNPVNAQATCTFVGTNPVTQVLDWTGNTTVTPMWIEDLGVAATSPIANAKVAQASNRRQLKRPNVSVPIRQCFLTGVTGIDTTWNNPGDFVRVRAVTTVDSTHPKTGWYIESNLENREASSSLAVYAQCVDFPPEAIVTRKSAPLLKTTKTYMLTQGSGVKLCALTEVGGQFTQPSWTDGVIMNWPWTLDGDWSLTVSPNKTAAWACVQ